MTLEELRSEAIRLYDENPEWRLGQSYMNVLRRNDYPLYEQVMNEGVDPFYDDKLLPDFFEFIEKRLS